MITKRPRMRRSMDMIPLPVRSPSAGTRIGGFRSASGTTPREPAVLHGLRHHDRAHHAGRDRRCDDVTMITRERPMHLIPDRQTASRCAALARGAVLALGAAMLLGSESTAGTDGPAPRSAGEVKAMMQLLASPGDASPQDRFLARMRQYRYLCGVPYEGLRSE